MDKRLSLELGEASGVSGTVKTGNVHAGHRSRLKEQFLKNGAESLSRHQLVELLLYFGIPQRDTNPIAHQLTRQYAQLSDMLAAPIEELLRVPGMTQHAAVLLRVCAGVVNECQREGFRPDKILDSIDKCVRYVIPLFIGIQTEKVMLVCLNHLGKVLGSGVICEGSATAAEINLRQALQFALRHNATAVILAHNHPCGLAVPSKEDIETTKAIAKGLSVAEIQLIDHIIVAGNDAVSMRATPLYQPIFLWDWRGKTAVFDGTVLLPGDDDSLESEWRFDMDF